MSSLPIIDTHLHLWDPKRLANSWQKGNALLNCPCNIEHYREASEGINTEAMIFVECHVDEGAASGQYMHEIEFVEEEAQRDPRIRAIVAKAPLERGAAVTSMLEEMAARFPRLRGIHRIPEFEPDPHGFMLNPKFLEGVTLLRRFNLRFELNVHYTQMESALEFLERAQDVPIVLDHCGKPGVKGGHISLFRRHMQAVAAHPNVICKLSDLAVEADWTRWTEAELRPFIEVTLEAFGTRRVMYGGDWPVCLQAISLPRWVEVLDRTLAGPSPEELRLFYRDNAHASCRLGF
jgi:L-fuconolactonase